MDGHCDAPLGRTALDGKPTPDGASSCPHTAPADEGFPGIAGHDGDDATNGWKAGAAVVEALAPTGDINAATASAIVHDTGPQRRADVVLRIPMFPPEMTQAEK